MNAAVRSGPLTWPGAFAFSLLGVGAAACREQAPPAGLDVVPVLIYTNCVGLADAATFSAPIGITLTAGGQILQRAALAGRLCDSPLGRGPLWQDGQPPLPAAAFCLPPGGPPVTAEICATGYQPLTVTGAVDAPASTQVPLCGAQTATARYAPFQIDYGLAPATGDAGAAGGCAALEQPPVNLAGCDCGSRG